MFMDYRPDGGELQRFEWRPGRIKSSDAAMLERTYTKLAGEKRTYDQFKSDVVQGSAVARRVLLHHLIRQQHPQSRIEDIDPYDDEMTLLFSRSELEQMRDEAEKTNAIPAADKDALLAKLAEEIETAPESEAEGKARSKTSDVATG
jgi:hypothetical protein